MTYIAAALTAIPITTGGIFVVTQARDLLAKVRQCFVKRDAAVMLDARPASIPDINAELRFTQSLLALSKVRSPIPGGSPALERDESSSLVLAHRAQSKIHDQGS